MRLLLAVVLTLSAVLSANAPADAKKGARSAGAKVYGYQARAHGTPTQPATSGHTHAGQSGLVAEARRRVNALQRAWLDPRGMGHHRPVEQGMFQNAVVRA